MKKIIKLCTLLILIVGVIGVIRVQPANADILLEPLQVEGRNVYHYDTIDPVMIPTTYTEQSTEFRGVWVATVWNIDFPKHTSEAQYKSEFTALIDEMVANNMNAMVFQVRSINDAWFDSAYAPWSRWITGTEGTDPGWDLMSWMIEECHANGIEFHAWLNPYRVANTTYDNKTSLLNTLHAENWAKINPDMVIEGDTYSQNGSIILPIILNPGEPDVKTYIRDVVAEIITNYNVDGIHFDDYFYPSSGTSSDTVTYNTYKEVGQTLEEWRRENVNDIVRGIKEDIDAYNLNTGEMVRFGISPSGVWASDQQVIGGSNTSPIAHSSYLSQHADTKRWVEEGWLHYIAPQIYRDFEHSLIPYADIVDWWASVARGTEVDLIIGHALYMDHFNNEEVSTQLRYNQKHPEIKGSIMYSFKWMTNARFQPVLTNNWTVTPLNIWQTSDVDGPNISIEGTLDGNVYISDVVVTLTAVDNIFYRIDEGDWTPYTVPVEITGEGAHVIYTKTVNDLGEESLINSRNIPIQYRNMDVPSIVITGEKIGDNYILNSILTFTSASETIWYAINHGNTGEWTEYTAPITLDDAGGYYIRAKTIDSKGTESEEVSIIIEVQQNCFDNPVLTIEGNIDSNDPYYNDVTFTIESETSILYKINDSSWDLYSIPLIFNTEGAYTVTYKNDDVCGIEQSKTITIDTTAPTAPEYTMDGDFDGKYYTSESILTLTKTDDDSTLFYRLHNGATWSIWQEYTTPIDLIFNVNYTIEAYTIDEAGNKSDSLYQLLRMNIPPSEDNMYVIRDGEIITYYNSSVQIELPTEYVEKTEEIRAVWVATVASIDIGLHINEEDYKSKILIMLDTIERNNFNTMFFQVRPMNDAFYDSDFAPWSEYLTGVQGQDPGWDVLGFIIEEAHKRGIEVHAWLNPYRVNTLDLPKAEALSLLHDDNYAKLNPDLVLQDKYGNYGKLILNPGEPQVQAYIKNVIREIMTKYDIDGIHFDDYFYSYNGMSDIQDADTYDTYKNVGESLDDWRRRNIDELIRDIFEIVEEHNATKDTNVKFGISPFGIWLSGGEEGSNTSPYALQSYKDQYADSKKWVEEGWLHYILPQLYWEFDHSAAPFADLALWWAELTEGSGVDLIIGHGFYRYASTSSAWDADNELLEQLRYISQFESVIGSSFFSYKTLNLTDPEVTQAMERLNEYYWTKYVTFPWESDVEKLIIPECSVDQVLIDNVCVDIPVCEANEVLQDNECVCDSGYEDIAGTCTLIVVPPTCDVNEEIIDNECVCKTGYELTDDVCTLIEEEPEIPKNTGCFSSIGNASFIFTIGTIGLLGFGILAKRKFSV